MTNNTMPEPLPPATGEIRIFSGNFVPRGWAYCDGHYLPIAQHSMLFSIIGTMYGGNGTTNFAVPNLIGRTPVGEGKGPGLNDKIYGHFGGMEYNTLSQINIPSHSHEINITPRCFTPVGIHTGSETNNPEGNCFGQSTTKMYHTDYNTTLGESNIDIKLNDQPKLEIGYSGGIPDLKVKGDTTGGRNNKTESFPIMQEYIVLNYIICLDGDYPSRN